MPFKRDDHGDLDNNGERLIEEMQGLNQGQKQLIKFFTGEHVEQVKAVTVIAKELQEQGKTVDKLDKKIFGNGKPGLDEELTGIKKDIQAIKEAMGGFKQSWQFWLVFLLSMAGLLVGIFKK